jgi:starch synthase (maltosyl-transferring)
MEEMRQRAVIENVRPIVDGGANAAKRIEGDRVKIEADIYGDGHDVVNAWVYVKHNSERKYSHCPLKALVNDAWEGHFSVDKIGQYHFYIEAWVDYALNWQHELIRKVKGGQHVNVELLDGLQYLKHLKPKDADSKALIKQCKSAFEDSTRYKEALEFAMSPGLKKLFETFPYHTFSTRSAEYPLWVDRKKAMFSAWYEFFPRSSGSDPTIHGSFDDAAKRLPYVAEMGFDVVYFPPIHPIGELNRKGKNNATSTVEGDVGSPWAIGSKLGGHKDINPALGTLDDFKNFVAQAKLLGIDVAIDYALQCAPDHPYVKQHPGWFRWRPDGTVQYAENPPKKYQDILPIFFECDDWENLWNELLSIVTYWIDQGITIFRVDNPHTKPFKFWKWLIAKIREKHPEVMFLSEAFTRPKVMHQLAKLGFTHSYTYFTWRNSKAELMQYMDELISNPSRQYFKPNFWPNTPDILPYELQQPNEATFLLRYFMAATLSSNYGMYGPVYENMLYQAVPGKEEYYDSEKYEVTRHVWDPRGKLKTVIKTVNQIRRYHPALQDTYNYVPCPVDNPQLMAWFKSDGENDHMLFVVNLDPYRTQAGMVQVPLQLMEMHSGQEYQVTDLITQASYPWQGEYNYVALNPSGLPFHCFQIRH